VLLEQVRAEALAAISSHRFGKAFGIFQGSR